MNDKPFAMLSQTLQDSKNLNSNIICTIDNTDAIRDSTALITANLYRENLTSANKPRNGRTMLKEQSKPVCTKSVIFSILSDVLCADLVSKGMQACNNPTQIRMTTAALLKEDGLIFGILSNANSQD